jgi:hypothetical protein
LYIISYFGPPPARKKISNARILLRPLWVLAPGGVCLVDEDAEPRPVLKFFDLVTKRTTKIALLEKEPYCCGQGLAISPDGHSILYREVHSFTADLLLVENFR